MYKQILILVLCITMAGVVYAQQCNTDISATTPIHRFTLNGDGTITDLYSGLRWQRCPVGYELDTNGTPDELSDDECRLTGTATFNWQGALQSADELNAGDGFAGFSDWYVPNVKELASIIEYKCADPAINLAIFPNTEPVNFWTSTAYNELIRAAVINFEDGTNSSSYKDSSGFEHYVRLVRDDG